MLKIFNFVLIIIGIVIAIAILMGSLILSGNETTKRLTNTTLKMHLEDDKYFGQNFMIKDYHYFDRSILDSSDNTTNITEKPENICLNPRSKEIVILKLELDATKLPDRCDIYIDNLHVKALDVNDYDCRPHCITKRIEQQVDLKKQNVFEEHELKVCCDEVCASTALLPIC